ncbi:GGDEF domain-containing protein [Vibrio diabolicus]|uniref:GGDEF domain-containing protein n=1 Tax=Vibrio diabolicus TaxID=50719 RepID=UPI00373ECB58
MDNVFNEFETQDLQDFYVDLGQRIIKHQDARLSLFYLLQYHESRNCNYGNQYIIKYKLDFSDLLDEAFIRFDNNVRIKAIKEKLSVLLEFTNYILTETTQMPISKDNYRHLISLMKNLDRSIEVFRKEMTHALTYTDELTGLFNRTAFEQDMENIHSESMKFNYIYCIALIDIDDFKRINDTYGHLAGDDVLESISDIIQSSIRPNDKAYRYGGEEIAIVLKNCNVEDALSVVERLRNEICNSIFISDEIELRVTISTGVSGREVNDKNFREILDRADKNLYEAKGSGKNITVFRT